MARPTTLTPEVHEQVERELAGDVPVVVVAQNAGVSPRTDTHVLADEAELDYGEPVRK